MIVRLQIFVPLQENSSKWKACVFRGAFIMVLYSAQPLGELGLPPSCRCLLPGSGPGPLQRVRAALLPTPFCPCTKTEPSFPRTVPVHTPSVSYHRTPLGGSSGPSGEPSKCFSTEVKSEQIIKCVWSYLLPWPLKIRQ